MKMFPLMMSILLTLPVFAHENCGEPEFHELSELLAFRKKIEWEAATPREIQKANCLRKEPFTIDEMNDWMSKNQSPYKISKSINGINFKDESPESLDAFYYLTTTLEFGGAPDPKKKRTFKSSCTKVDCALKEIFGPEVGVQLKFMQQKYGMNGSHLVEDATSPWMKPELDTILLALSDFPDGLFPVEKSRPIVHVARGLNNDNTLANAVINIYDLWNQQSPEIARSTITHELGHVIARHSGIDTSPEWMSKGGWAVRTKVKGNEKIVVQNNSSKPETMVSEYGMTNEWEDFAESVVAYRYNPELLKHQSPEKYRMVSETVFDGIEYTSKESCQSPNRLSQMAAAKIANKLQAWEPNASELKTISNKCGPLLIRNFAATGSINSKDPELENCYAKSIKAEAAEMAKKEFSNNPNYKFMDPLFKNLDPQLSSEKLASIISKVQNQHRSSIREQFTKAFNYQYFCEPDFYQYAYNQFNENDLGFDSYNQVKDFESIAKKSCPKVARSTPSATAEELIK